MWHLGFSPIQIDKLKELLENYPDRDVASLLYNGFTKGFRLEYTGPSLKIRAKQQIMV
jgi:hypothetical protein